MAWSPILDESGQDRHQPPYEVLAGVAVEDQRIWPLISAIHEADERFFGMRITHDGMELEAKKLLEAKAFELAAQMEPIEPKLRTRWVHECLVSSKRKRQCSVSRAKPPSADHALRRLGANTGLYVYGLIPHRGTRSRP